MRPRILWQVASRYLFLWDCFWTVILHTCLSPESLLLCIPWNMFFPKTWLFEKLTNISIFVDWLLWREDLHVQSDGWWEMLGLLFAWVYLHGDFLVREAFCFLFLEIPHSGSLWCLSKTVTVSCYDHHKPYLLHSEWHPMIRGLPLSLAPQRGLYSAISYFTNTSSRIGIPVRSLANVPECQQWPYWL